MPELKKQEQPKLMSHAELKTALLGNFKPDEARVPHGSEIAERDTGVPQSHAAAFQKVADDTNTVIMSRAVGMYATGLINENYSSKGFHNKAKSCDWGPAAGFVLDDPRLTKRGPSGAQAQRNDLEHAYDDGATTESVYITRDRVDWLKQNAKDCGITHIEHRDDGSILMTAGPKGPNPEPVLFKLRKADNVPGADGHETWQVLSNSRATSKDNVVEQGGPDTFFEVKGVVDRMVVERRADATNPQPPSFRDVTTGDYDLFEVMPHVKGTIAFEAGGQPNDNDKRYRPGADIPAGEPVPVRTKIENFDVRHLPVGDLEESIRTKVAPASGRAEDEHKGNTTPRIESLIGSLNEAFGKEGYTGGGMVHHSDEAGRPFVAELDLPVFAVVPGMEKPFVIKNVDQFRDFNAQLTAAGYVPSMNPGWMNQLTSGVTNNVGIRNELNDREALAKELGTRFDELKMEMAGRDGKGQLKEGREYIMGTATEHRNPDKLYVKVEGDGTTPPVIKVFDRKDLPPDLANVLPGQPIGVAVKADQGKLSVETRSALQAAATPNDLLKRAQQKLKDLDRFVDPQGMTAQLKRKGYEGAGELQAGEQISGKVTESTSTGVTAILKDGNGSPGKRDVRVFKTPDGGEKLQPGMKVDVSMSSHMEVALKVVALPVHAQQTPAHVPSQVRGR